MTKTTALWDQSRNLRNRYEEFNLVDEKRRYVGANVRIDTVEFVADERGYDSREPGVWYSLNVQATRNGIRYGAGQANHYCKTLDAAESKARVLVAAMRKRYAHKYG